jgi:hypothetical protein
VKTLAGLALVLFLGIAQADEPNTTQREVVTAFGAALVQGVCAAVEQPALVAVDDKMLTEPFADNKDLHGCQYISETLASGCNQDHSCTSYDQWTNLHPSISPKLPRAVFLENLAARQAQINLASLGG